MSDTPYLNVDAEYFPLVRQTGRGDLSQADWQSLFDTYDEIYARRQRFAVLVDIRAVTKVPGAAERSRIADWTNANVQITDIYHLGSALVVKSGLVKGAMTAITWLMRPKTPQVFMTGVDEGATWCLEALRKADVAIPPRTVEYLEAMRRGEIDPAAQG